MNISWWLADRSWCKNGGLLENWKVERRLSELTQCSGSKSTEIIVVMQRRGSGKNANPVVDILLYYTINMSLLHCIHYS
jgi:hypothetical protein